MPAPTMTTFWSLSIIVNALEGCSICKETPAKRLLEAEGTRPIWMKRVKHRSATSHDRVLEPGVNIRIPAFHLFTE